MDFKKEIIEILRDGADIETKNIAAMLGTTKETVDAAIKELKDEGTLLKYTVVLNTEAMGEEAPAEALIEIKVEPKADFGYEDIARRIYKFPEVKALYLMSGRYDFSIRAEGKSVKAISKFVWEKLAVLEGVRSTETLFIMRKYKENGVVLDSDEQGDRLVVTP